MIHKFPIAGEWRTIDSKQLDAFHNGTKEQRNVAQTISQTLEAMDRNPLAYFLPHGVPYRKRAIHVKGGNFTIQPSEYSDVFSNDGQAFLSDYTSDICMMIAQNQGGKTYCGAAWSALRIIPCEKDWPIFTQHGVEYREWGGPKTWVVASYSWDNVLTAWKRYREILPRQELGPFALGWGRYDDEKGKPRDLAIGSGKASSQTLRLACGSVIKFLAYGQPQVHWEGFDSDGAHFDEQPPVERFVGWKRSTTTRGDYTPCCFTLTGHVVEGRPDTGSGGWIKRDLWDGNNTRGSKVSRYHISVDSVPDVILSKKKRKELYDTWANPKIKRSEKDERAAVARYWGGWEEGSGMVFDADVWQRKIHVIPPLWPDDKVPQDWTKWRVIDYGDNGTSCCSWFAVGPKYAVLYRMLYEKGLTVFKLIKTIVEMSHNQLVKIGDDTDFETGDTFSIYKEEQTGEKFYRDLLDSRSYSMNKNNALLSELFERYGMKNIDQACGGANFKKDNEGQIPVLKEWLRIDYTRPHVTRKNEDGTPQMGAPRLYFFEGKTVMGVAEIEELQLDFKQNHHFIDTAKYWANDDPRYMGDAGLKQERILHHEGSKPTPYTGY